MDQLKLAILATNKLYDDQIVNAFKILVYAHT